MLCESLTLLLVERGIIHKVEATEAIEGIIELKVEAAGASESVVVSLASIGLLQNIARSVDAARAPETGARNNQPPETGAA